MIVNIGLAMVVYSPYLAFLPMIYLLYYLIRKGELSLKNPWNIGIALLFFWSFIVGIINENEMSTLASLVILGLLLVSVYFQDKYQTVTDVERLFFSIFLFSIGSALMGILEHFNIITYSPTWWKYLLGTRSIDDITESYRISGTFNNPNLAGTWYAIMILFGVYFFKKSEGIHKVWFAVGTALFVTVLMMTGSRGAVIGLFFGFVIYSYFSGHKKKMLFLMFTLLSGITLMLNFPEWFPRGEILFSSIRDRQAIWENALYMFMMKPVTGWGLLGIYYADSSIYHYLRVFHAHNTLLTIATTLGVVGLSIFLWMEWSLLQEIRLLYQKKCRITPLLGGIQAIVLGQGLFDFTIMSPQVALLFVVSSTLIGSLAYSYIPQTIPTYPLTLRYKKSWKKA
ncbi:O-Antigen ligase [Tepidibacillus sp. HK-1]|nr:O-Antigen ligase [Tepidibacillus sp. HK-1]